MKKAILASRFDIPFYFRLPSMVFFTWDPELDVAAVYPRQRLGEISFSKISKLLDNKILIDSSSSFIKGLSSYNTTQTCTTEEYGELPTLSISIGETGGFSELRAYCEINIFTIIIQGDQIFTSDLKNRVFKVLNHFIDIYRITTQDPYVHRINEELDTYLIDYSVGEIPLKYEGCSSFDILSHLQEIKFPTEIGTGRSLVYRLNTFEDLFPGKTLERNYLDLFTQFIRKGYNMPLHYELIFTAQVELKRRNFHIAILEAETAFEVYIANALVRISALLGDKENEVLADMENPKKLGLLSQRLRELDLKIDSYRENLSLSSLTPFCETVIHKEWKGLLYNPRNDIIHKGWRSATFEIAKRGIAAVKAAIIEIEERIPGIANPIQIYPGVDHLQETAGRLKF